MLTQILQLMTPEQIISSLQANPLVVLEVLRKFKAFKLMGECMTEHQQTLVSKNLNRLNEFLASDSGKASINLLADEFIAFVNKDVPKIETPQEMEARIRAEIRAELLPKAIEKAPKT